jgi:hypothetical protein
LNNKDYESIICRSNVFFEKFKKMVEKASNADLTSHILLESLRDADTCITLQPRSEGGYLSKINVLRNICEITQAKEICAEGLRLIPGSVKLSLVANVMTEERDYDEGEELKKILENGIREQHAANQKTSRSSHNHKHSHTYINDHDQCNDHRHAAGCACPGQPTATTTTRDTSTNVPKPTRPECMHCGRSPAKLLLCSACKSVSYCGNMNKIICFNLLVI